MNDALRRELLDLQAEDARVRGALERDGRLFRGYDPEMEVVHRRNAARLREIIAAHGWPTRSLVGDGAEAAWLIAQQDIAEPSFQRQALKLLDEACGRGDVPAWQPAYLLDRIRMFEGWPQVYGTQMAPDEQGGMEVWPIADRGTLNERRRSVGLPPFEERRVTPTRERSPDEPRADRASMDAWARKTGWRNRILHLTTEPEWANVQHEGAYRAASLETEGFIHCSEPQQLVSVANRRFRNRHDLVLMHIDIARLTSGGRYENLEGGTDLFPHVYGPVNRESIVKVTPFRPGPAGDFDHDHLAAVY